VTALTLDDFHGLGLPPAEMIVGRMDHVHELFLAPFEYEPVDDLPDGQEDLVVLIGPRDRRSKLRRLVGHKGRLVVVLAGSDYALGTDIVPPGSVLPPNFTSVFAVNNDSGDPRVVNVPLGVRAETAPLCRQAIEARPVPRDGLLYGNFSLKPLVYRAATDGTPHPRRRLAKRFEGVPWATMNVADRHREGDDAVTAYLAELARHKFVLSPEGLGADCYRHWECLYLGAIPIVRASPAMAPFSDLPILFSEDFSEIDRPYLEAQWERFRSRRFDLDRLTRSFYRERFLASVARLSKPRFLAWGLREANFPQAPAPRAHG
jgi:hypothetical protein